MKKNKLYIILAILITMSLFAVSATCNQCGGNLDELEDTGEETAVEEEIAGEDGQAEDTEGIEEGAGVEEIIEEEEEAEEETEEEEETQSADEEPTIELKVYEGPLYSQADDVCYWRVKAVVTGVPTPAVEFSRDDSNGAWGSRKAQVNLTSPADSYNLSATATNSEGTATDFISLNWECNRPPEISDITLMGDHYTGIEYTISAAASDLDNDPLTYSWSVSGGTLDSSSGNPIKWTMPGTAGVYQITVDVDDGNGGTDSRTESVDVIDGLGPPLAAMDLPIISSEGGYISKNGTLFYRGHGHNVGDSSGNEAIKSFVSFDISGLAGATIESAELQFSPFEELGDASGFVPLWIAWTSWEPGEIVQNDFSITSNAITNVGTISFTILSSSAPKLKHYIQEAINGGKNRFQIVLYFSMASDNDNSNDYWAYIDSGIRLFVRYTP